MGSNAGHYVNKEVEHFALSNRGVNVLSLKRSPSIALCMLPRSY